MNARFHTMLPIPKPITRTAVILFLLLGNSTHIMFKIGIELIANIEPGTMIELMMNV